ncbi:hypothetical protein C8R28_102730 [Nitrosomonas ureae]|uniref:Uncharacterized protein n=2 Tax=Nitrosomonas ureae TaxID=44577 RepID=A0A2T5IEY8_9PROT|nr:hypothetical protein C8R28_102730 [Nitrosomonas ureae]
MVHSNKDQCPHQRIVAVAMGEYRYWVPYVEADERVILITVVPNRKAARQYLKVSDERGLALLAAFEFGKLQSELTPDHKKFIYDVKANATSNSNS